MQYCGLQRLRSSPWQRRRKSIKVMTHCGKWLQITSLSNNINSACNSSSHFISLHPKERRCSLLIHRPCWKGHHMTQPNMTYIKSNVFRTSAPWMRNAITISARRYQMANYCVLRRRFKLHTKARAARDSQEKFVGKLKFTRSSNYEML